MEIEVSMQAQYCFIMAIKRRGLLDSIKRRLRAAKHLRMTIDGTWKLCKIHGAGILCSSNSPQIARI